MEIRGSADAEGREKLKTRSPLVVTPSLRSPFTMHTVQRKILTGENFDEFDEI